MNEYLPDIVAVLGLASLTGGVFIAFGLSWALMVAGLVMITIGILAAWKRSS